MQIFITFLFLIVQEICWSFSSSTSWSYQKIILVFSWAWLQPRPAAIKLVMHQKPLGLLGHSCQKNCFFVWFCFCFWNHWTSEVRLWTSVGRILETSTYQTISISFKVAYIYIYVWICMGIQNHLSYWQLMCPVIHQGAKRVLIWALW